MSKTVDWHTFFAHADLPERSVRYYAKLFTRHEMELDMIPSLTHDVLLQIGVTKVGHRIKILRAQSTSVDWKQRQVTTPAQVSPQAEGPMKLRKANSSVAKNLGHSTEAEHKAMNMVKQNSLQSLAEQGASTLEPSSPRRVNSKLPPVKRGLKLSGEPDSLQTDNQPVEDDEKRVLAFYINDEPAKHRLIIPAKTITVGEFTQQVTQLFKSKLNEEWALFCPSGTQKLLIIKDNQQLSVDNTYFLIFNSRVQDLTKKLEKKLRKEYDVYVHRNNSGKPVYTSENHPIQVDYIPDEELYMSEMGRIGICMAPGRTKKKKYHDWARDLSADLGRIRNVYECDVFVTLVRHLELVDIAIPNLFEEVEKRGMESIHFPIKDKWVPDSMDQLILLVETIITRLRQGKTVVVHCNGGKGRSGTVVVAALIGLGRKVEHSIDIVRRSRSGTIRNPLQIAYVKKFKTVWRKRHKEKMATVQQADEEDEEVMDPEELAIWKKWEEKLLQEDEEKDAVKSPMVEPVIESDGRPSEESVYQSSGGSSSGIGGSGGSSGLTKTSSSRQPNPSPSGSKDKKRDSGLRGSLWKKKDDKDRKEDNKGKSKEELKSEEKKRKQDKHYAKKVEKQQKALEKQKMKVAKENARLLAAQSPPLAVGTSRRSTDQSMASDSSAVTPLHASVHIAPSATNLGSGTRTEGLTHSGLNETMTTVAEVKEDEISSNDKEKAKRLSVNLGPDHDDTQKHTVEKQDSGLGRKEHHEGTDDSTSYKDTTEESTPEETSESSTELQDSSA